MTLHFKLRNETKSCYRFEAGSTSENTLITLYLKKADITAAKIKPQNGIAVTITEDSKAQTEDDKTK
jgi:hypothetical protein